MELIRIGELARRSGVSVATIKFYLREGLIVPARRSGRTMSWYDPALVGKLQAIKELQRRRFLPLEMIREALGHGEDAADDLAAAQAIAKIVARHGGTSARSRADVLAGGASEAELAWLERTGMAVPDAGGIYRGDDLALLVTLGAARRAGLAAEMLPFDILRDYVGALQRLVEVELRMFRAGVIGRARRGEVERLTEVATELSERLVVLVRRKLLLPTLRRLTEETAHEPRDPPRRPARPRRRVRQQPARRRRDG